MPASPDPQAVVLGFGGVIEAWPSGSSASLARFFDSEAEYCNGPLPPVRGRDAIVGSLAQMMTLRGSVAVQMLHVIADGPTVMTERVDYWRADGDAATLRVAGVFEVHEGVVTAWRDYFDAEEFTSQLPTADQSS